MVKLVKGFDVPWTTLTTIPKKKDNAFLTFSKSIRENTIQWAAILNKEHFLPLPGFGIELKSHFRGDLL